MATKVRARLRAMMPAKTRAMPTDRRDRRRRTIRRGRDVRRRRLRGRRGVGLRRVRRRRIRLRRVRCREPRHRGTRRGRGSDVAGDVYKRIFISGCRPRLPLNSFADEHVLVERLGDGVCEGPEVLRVLAVVRDQGIERVVVAAFVLAPEPDGVPAREVRAVALDRFPSRSASAPRESDPLAGT